MLKIQPIVREIVLGELEAYFALTNGYMNMSSYAHRIKSKVEAVAKKPATITSLVVSLSRLRKEFKKEKLESLHKNVSLSQEDFFTTTIGTTEIDIICSANLESKVLKHFKIKPKYVNHNFAAIGVSFGPEVFGTPNIFFSLLSITARAQVNIEELISTPTELTFIVAEKDFGKTVALFSELHRKANT